VAKKISPYYDEFVALIGYSCKAAKKLQHILQSFDTETLPAERDEMHTIEHEADREKHKMMEKLVREFITPIEREDIIDLAQSIDEVTDKVEDVLMRIYMYHIDSIRAEALEFADLIVKCCDNLMEALKEFYNFRKQTNIHDHVVEVNTLEEKGDKLYVDTVHQIYGEDEKTAVKIGWVRTFDRLEDCCDACEQVANLIESIIMKNT
jgi:predicted phosphate transport protein (TIGR00153 family)